MPLRRQESHRSTLMRPRLSFIPFTVIRRPAKAFGALRSSPLSNSQKRYVRRAIRRISRTSLKESGTVELLGYNISFQGADHLRYIFTEIFAEACYFFKVEGDRPFIVDCGSNIGLSVLFFKWVYPSSRIVAFEPDPSTFAILKKNIEANGLADVDLHPVALSGVNGVVAFYRDEDDKISSGTMSTSSARHSGRRIEVVARRLSEFIDREVDLLKLDVEGSEADVLQDLFLEGKLPYIKRMHVEYHHHVGSKDDKFARFLMVLEDAGFGYQVKSSPDYWGSAGIFQDISLYCYKKAPISR
jgi:FkbM family methyltransferase